MTLHHHKFNSGTVIRDGEQPLQVPSGWQIAEGNDDDICVCFNHPWQTDWLIFAGGDMYGTSICSNPSYAGECTCNAITVQTTCRPAKLFLNISLTRLKLGRRFAGEQLKVDTLGTRSVLQNADVLLRLGR
jgi:hypothetical protein